MLRSIVDNVTLPHLDESSRLSVVGTRGERRAAVAVMDRLDVRAKARQRR